MSETAADPKPGRAAPRHAAPPAEAALQAPAPGTPDDPFHPDSDRMAAARWLYSRGWRPQGSPHHEYTRWTDPQKPTQDTYRKEVKLAPHITTWNDQKKQYDTEMRPVMVKDKHGQAIPCAQTVLVPAGQPYPINLAMEIQIAREREAQEKQAAAAA